MAMYEAWAAYDTVAQTYLLGKAVGGHSVPFTSATNVYRVLGNAKDRTFM